MIFSYVQGVRRQLQYLYYAVRQPQRKAFVDMGLGIDARYARCSSAWQVHLERCKAVQREAFSACSGGSVVVLGAGRLFDVDLRFLLDTFSTVTLVDADPSVWPAWRKAKGMLGGKKLRFLLTDLTGAFDQVASEVRTIAEDRTATPESIRSWLANITLSTQWPLAEEYDAVISANLAGQIPIYFRDYIESHLHKAFKVPTAELGGGVDEALQSFERRLIAQHIHHLAGSSAATVVCIADIEFTYYLPCGKILERVPVVSENLTVDGYTQRACTTWRWDIAPPHAEGLGYGIYHYVGGWVFDR